jgi:Phage integrase family
MAEMSPVRRRMTFLRPPKQASRRRVEDMTGGHDGPQSVAGDATIRRSGGLEVEPLFWSIAGSAGPGRCPRLPGSPGVDRDLLAGFEPDRLRAALLLRTALRFGHGEIPERIPYAREPRKLPVVPSADEVVRFLEAVPSLKTRAALMTADAAGLRAAETVGLKVGEVDSGRMMIRVEAGKGGKDRYVICRRSCLGSCGPIGASPGRGTGSSPAAGRRSRSTCRCFTRRAVRRARRPASTGA